MIHFNDGSGAILSDCQRYRYRLWRRWDYEKPALCWVMLNPSTADAATDDPTIRKCIGFAKRLGYGGIDVVNLYAWRATDPREIARADDPVGPLNDATLLSAARTAGESNSSVICAWGAHARRSPRAADVLDLLRFQATAFCQALRINAGGEPAHPLMLPYSCEPVEMTW